ncbi:chitin synthase-domain-containing protein [Auriculariales sp. MPI-PUGE-AT-0066]|nr:chitin synthase-domain-containing protein [Auriculariales sp. MPI-PUGE-AT-0066]
MSAPYGRPVPQPQSSMSSAIKFDDNERGDRAAPLPSETRAGRYTNAAYASAPLPPTPNDLEALEDAEYAGGQVGRKKSLVRPDRERIDPSHRLWNYREHAREAETKSTGRIGLLPSTTGNYPQDQPQLRRGRSLLGREQDVQESGLSIFKRGQTLRRKNKPSPAESAAPDGNTPAKRAGLFDNIGPGPKDAWFIYCYIITCCFPPFFLSLFGIRTPEQQRAWREKMGLLSIIGTLMLAVGFLTFGFTQTVCGKPPTRFQAGTVGNSSIIIHGYDYDFSTFKHPRGGPFDGKMNPLFEGGYNVASMDLSFMFQNVNQQCRGIIQPATGTSITVKNGDLQWYFPCNPYNQYGTSPPNRTDYAAETTCHTDTKSRSQLAAIHSTGQVYYSWANLTASGRNLAVFEQTVLDLSLLLWLDKSQVTYPALFDQIMKGNDTWTGKDITMMIYRSGQKDMARCLQDITTVGFIDTQTIGCVASQVVLYVSLVFIIGVVAIRFGMAVIFGWFLAWQIGAFKGESYRQRMARQAEIENWTEDIYRPAPSQYRPNAQNGLTANHKAKKGNNFLPSTSRFSRADIMLKGQRPVTAYGNLDPASYRKSLYAGGSKGSSPMDSRKSMMASSPLDSRKSMMASSLSVDKNFTDSTCPFPLYNVVPQPPADYQPFNFPLAHTICLVTAYSESFEGLRTTLDSIATTDYPNSHKLIMVIADGMVKGSGNSLYTPDIVLTMMKDLVVPADEVQPHSYVAIADGHKRHNMAKVYAGFYDYDNETVEKSKQQRVPIVLVAKCGNPLERGDAKPGNRGKRDSQIVLMGFLQKVMFDERMTTFEYEFFNSIWRVTGVCPDRYEMVLCVDADTKAFPDSLTRMVACMVNDEEVMGLCGETKIANKSETWVTMIQVFEYYISHHLTKAFESVFGGVTCLPGCFSMYRIKTPKGQTGYWVPILANPDIVEHYSENVVDTLHKKNLLLLGEDRYLTTLMLKTFPKRKMIFCPQAVCKTIVPDTFTVLLSQRRRWINSTIHNLFELLLVRDLCGTFCFSMQFVVFMELAGTLVLPAAISFTIYLIIITIVNATHGDASQTLIPLILLGIILGLPGLLIVITTRKVAYLGWMLIYLASLPVWNFVLPAYSFWHFDDFSWGQTRMVAGEKKTDKHGEKEGEFDSSHIVMKRWAEFERDRRWRSAGASSRNSVYGMATGNSGGDPFRSPKRYSLVSSMDSYGNLAQQQYAGEFGDVSSPRSRHDSARTGQYGLVAPPVIGQQRAGSASPSRRSEEVSFTGSNSRLIPSPGTTESLEELPPHGQLEFQRSGNRGSDGTVGALSLAPSASSTAEQPLMAARGAAVPIRQSTVPREHPGETSNPYRFSQAQQAQVGTVNTFDDDYSVAEPVMMPRGVSLVDPGYAPSQDNGVRRVSRQAARRSTQVSSPVTPMSPASPVGGASAQSHASSRYSRQSPGPGTTLPPGAAPPMPRYGQ